jgi:hypothetical protein
VLVVVAGKLQLGREPGCVRCGVGSTKEVGIIGSGKLGWCNCGEIEVRGKLVFCCRKVLNIVSSVDGNSYWFGIPTTYSLNTTSLEVMTFFLL